MSRNVKIEDVHVRVVPDLVAPETLVHIVVGKLKDIDTGAYCAASGHRSSKHFAISELVFRIQARRWNLTNEQEVADTINSFCD